MACLIILQLVKCAHKALLHSVLLSLSNPLLGKQPGTKCFTHTLGLCTVEGPKGLCRRYNLLCWCSHRFQYFQFFNRKIRFFFETTK